jgi:polysaccharide pyruvyl transferase WcaK-like protein
VLHQLSDFCQRALELGWEVHMVMQQGADDVLARYLRQTRPQFPLRIVNFRSRAEVYTYYRNVTVAVSTRGHGVMVPFGLRVATLSLVTHDKVGAFLSDIGHSEWGVECTPAKRPDGIASGIADELLGKLEHIHAHRALIYDQIVRAQARLMAATARNMFLFGEAMLANPPSTCAAAQQPLPQ